jgi:hypothetical protein
MNTLLSKIFKINELAIVGIFRNEEGETCNVLNTKKRGNKIEITSIQNYENENDFFEKIELKLPVIIVLDGKGVLNKKINYNNEADLSWHKNIDFSTIYQTSIKGTNDSFMSFCRKSMVDETIQKYQEKGITIIDVYIGSFLSSLLKNEINNDEVISSNLVLEFDENILINFKKKEDEVFKNQYSIYNERISSDILPLYGVLLHFYIQQKEVSKTVNENLNVEEITYKKIFSVAGTTILAVFLITLITSYLLIQHYGAKNAEFNQQNIYSNQSYQLILDLEKQKENKLKILQESGFLSSKFLSNYAYDIMRIMPSDIQLNELNIAPITHEVKENKEIELEERVIIVKGETYNEFSFNSWLEKLKKMDWQNKFEIVSLKKDKKNNLQFEVKIMLKNV